MNTSPPISTPTISVVMSCYNARRWLHQAICSVLAQTFTDFEFILVDDGSTDGTWDIIQGFRDRDDRIVAISKDNTGLTDSLNVGLAQANGTWIARLDADDLCESTRLAEQMDYLHRHPKVILLGSGFVEVDEHGRAIKSHRYSSRHSTLVRSLERQQSFFPHSSAIFRRDIAQDVGGYNTLFQKSQDWDMWLRLGERGEISCMPKYLVKVRKHFDQISNSTIGRSQRTYAVAASTCHFLRVQNCPDPSNNTDDLDWQKFIDWIDRRVGEKSVFESRTAWNNARTEYFTSSNKVFGGFRFSIRLLQSGNAGLLIREKLVGSSLSEHLAQEWMERSCVAL